MPLTVKSKSPDAGGHNGDADRRGGGSTDPGNRLALSWASLSNGLSSFGPLAPLFFASFIYFLFFLGHGSYFTSLSPHMLHRFGDRARYVFFAGQLLYPVGYFFAGWISDYTRRVRSLLILFLILQTPLQHALFLPELPFEMCVVSAAVTRFFFAANTQLLNIATLETLNFKGFSVSRSAGTVGFLFVQVGMLLLELYAFENASPEVQSGRGGQWGAAFMLLTAAFAFIFPARRTSHTDYFFKDALRVIREKRLLPFFVLSFLFYLAYQVVDYYLGGYLRQTGGMPFVYGGWALGVLIEIPFMQMTERLLQRFGLRSVLLIAIGAGALRFVILALDAAGLMRGFVLPQQVLHGIHFTGFYMGTVYLIRRVFPAHLFGTGMGLFMVLAVSSGGTLGSMLTGLFLREQFSASPYAWIFGTAAGLHVLVFSGFLFLSLPPQTAKNSDSDHATSRNT